MQILRAVVPAPMGLTATPLPRNVRAEEPMCERAHSDQRPRRDGPAYGAEGPPPSAKSRESSSPLARTTEAALAVGIAVPVLATYVLVVYVAFLVATALL